ncbi:MAG: ABC transporter permease subunit [Candidatus Woesebacteria bacterium]
MQVLHTLPRAHKRKTILTVSAILTILLIVFTIVAGVSVLDARSFFIGFFESLIRVVASYFISLVVAIILVLIATSRKWLEDILIPLFDVLQSFPSFALFPLFVVWFGKSSIVTIFILIISMIWPILFTLLTGQKEIDEELLEAAHIFQAKGLSYYTGVFFPLLLPAIVTGSIIAWGEAWEAIIAAEIIVQVPGVGTYLADSATNAPRVLFVGILALLVILFLINKFVWLKLLKTSTKYES